MRIYDIRIKRILLVLALAWLASCKGQTGPAPEQEAVLDSARANLVFVEGRTFKMGREAIENPEEILMDGNVKKALEM